MNLHDYLSDHPGHPLGRGMPTGGTLRDDGQSHRQAWASIVRRDVCSFCAGPAGTVDHIEPQAHSARGLGGSHSWLNFTAACERCNTGKADHSLLEWLYRRRWSQPIRSKKLAEFRRQEALRRAA